MLIEFSVENFLSFQKEAKLSMVAARSFREHKDTHTINIDKKMVLLKSAIIFGNNGSGKSNLIRAMNFMKIIVLNSFRDALLDNGENIFPLEKFALNSESEKKPSLFEISFIYNDVKYRYGFEIDNNQIISEWLFHTTSKEVFLFKREGQNIEINKSSFKEAIGKEKDVRENVLFLSLLATLGKETSSNIIDWFKKFRFINGINDSGHKKYTVEKLKQDEGFKKWILHFIKYLEISNLSTKEEFFDESKLDLIKDDEVYNLINSLNRKNKKLKIDQILTYHRKYDGSNLLIDTIPFNFEKQESDGTKKLIYLLGPWYDTLKNGTLLIVDELDSRLHSHLTSRLIEFFHLYNTRKAQLIFASHDTALLDKELFRRDQVWFVEKDQFGNSNLISLGDYKTDKVRNKSAFSKNYLNGKYGAIPYFDFDKELVDLLHG
ncbi:hypothetical protein CLV96_3946 [Leptospira meyeri]|uniref:ATPase AAA-type core domain-containing protein n=1 Tax=Leptospira meyeri TaxID=29508 RepID=A0A4V3HHQ9_LEPME|nr:ATP-binding protein [Leptospira meyeri]TDY66376.1 hypothetical protein CLV96_3946 [Leptospira meyeri]